MVNRGRQVQRKGARHHKLRGKDARQGMIVSVEGLILMQTSSLPARQLTLPCTAAEAGPEEAVAPLNHVFACERTLLRPSPSPCIQEGGQSRAPSANARCCPMLPPSASPAYLLAPSLPAPPRPAFHPLAPLVIALLCTHPPHTCNTPNAAGASAISCWKAGRVSCMSRQLCEQQRAVQVEARAR